MPILLFENERGEAREELLRDPDTTIGRASCNHVVIDYRRVSRIHAVLTRYGAFVHIRDLGSTNGTFVNGERVASQMLAHGDTIEIGDVKLRFLENAPQVVVAAPLAPQRPAEAPNAPDAPDAPESPEATQPSLSLSIAPSASPSPLPSALPEYPVEEFAPALSTEEEASLESFFLPPAPVPPPPHASHDPFDELLVDGPLDDLLDDEAAAGVPFAEWIEDTVAFHFRAEGKEVAGLISYEALADHFSSGALLGDVDIRAMEAYRQNAGVINAVAAKRHALGRREPVFLRTTDF